MERYLLQGEQYFRAVLRLRSPGGTRVIRCFSESAKKLIFDVREILRYTVISSVMM